MRIGCAIGRGGSQVASGGDPTYCEEAYTGADYQQFTARTVLFDTSVGYAPPNADPNDDGINFLSTLTAADVIDQPLVIENGPVAQRAAILDNVYMGGWSLPPVPFASILFPETAQERLQARSTDVANVLKEHETKATFKLKSMTREFSTPYDIQVTDVKIPTGYDLEVV